MKQRLEDASEYLQEVLDKLHWAAMDEHGALEKYPLKGDKRLEEGPKGLTYGELIEVLLAEVSAMAGALQERLISHDDAYLM